MTSISTATLVRQWIDQHEGQFTCHEIIKELNLQDKAHAVSAALSSLLLREKVLQRTAKRPYIYSRIAPCFKQLRLEPIQHTREASPITRTPTSPEALLDLAIKIEKGQASRSDLFLGIEALLNALKGV
jgi:hypothetical protein